MEKNIKSFEDLECWKQCNEVRRDIREIIKTFPDFEKYGLTDNMRRASRSVTQNIAEGYGRYHYKEYKHFCRTSRGSLYELIDQLITAKDDGYITEEVFSKTRSKIETAIKVLNGFINYLERRENEKQQ